jgi:hypothetical protein
MPQGIIYLVCIAIGFLLSELYRRMYPPEPYIDPRKQKDDEEYEGQSERDEEAKLAFKRALIDEEILKAKHRAAYRMNSDLQSGESSYYSTYDSDGGEQTHFRGSKQQQYRLLTEEEVGLIEEFRRGYR